MRFRYASKDSYWSAIGYWVNESHFAPSSKQFKKQTEQGIITPVSGNNDSLILALQIQLSGQLHAAGFTIASIRASSSDEGGGPASPATFCSICSTRLTVSRRFE